VRATPADLRAAFSFVYEPQLSQERAAAAAAAAASSSSGKAAARAAESLRKQAATAESANPAKALDGLLVSLLGGLSGSGGKAPAAKEGAGKEKGKQGFEYPPEDIAALNAAKRFLVSAGVVNK
jgi:membrane protein involved in colicin uptake